MPVWFITGCASGFGRDLASKALARGDRAVLTAPVCDDLTALAAAHPGAALVLELDVTDPARIAAAIDQSVARFGRIDHLVNTAGCGGLGAEQCAHERIDNYVLGLFGVTRAVLPVMRHQRAGHVINVAPPLGPDRHGARLHAVEHWSQSLVLESAPLGIRVTSVETAQTSGGLVDHDQNAAAILEIAGRPDAPVRLSLRTCPSLSGPAFGPIPPKAAQGADRVPFGPFTVAAGA